MYFGWWGVDLRVVWLSRPGSARIVLVLQAGCRGELRLPPFDLLRVIRGDTRRQGKSQLRTSRNDANQRIGKPRVHVGAGSSTDDDFCRDSWEWEACVEHVLPSRRPTGVAPPRRIPRPPARRPDRRGGMEGSWRRAG